MCWELWSVRKRPNAVFPEREQEKKTSRPITTIHQGSARDPPGRLQGAHFWIQRPHGCSRKSRKNKKNSPGHGTRDDDRISHALGTRPGEFGKAIQFSTTSIEPRLTKMQRKFIERVLKVCRASGRRKSIEHLKEINRTSIVHLSIIYQQSVRRQFLERLSNIY